MTGWTLSTRIKTLFLLVLINFGWVPNVQAETLFTFEGYIDMKMQETQVDVNFQNGGAVSALFSPSTYDQTRRFDLTLNNFHSTHFNIDAHINGNIAAINREFVTNLSSDYFVINDFPVEEFQGRLYWDGTDIKITNIVIDEVQIRGSVSLIPNLNFDIDVNLLDLGLNKFINMAFKNNRYDTHGTITGTVDVYGNANKTVIQADVLSKDGFVGKFAFNSIDLKAHGDYPMLDIDNTLVNENEGFVYSVEGRIDLARLQDIKKQLKELTFSPLIEDSPNTREWTIKRFGEYDKTGGRTDLKYFLRSVDETGNHGEEDAMIGVERTMEF